LKVSWFTFGCGSVRGRGVSWSRGKVGAVNMSARNLTNTRWVKAPVAGSLRVQQPCGGIDRIERNAIDAREQQRHLDDAISVAKQWWMSLTGAATVTLGETTHGNALCRLLGQNRGSPHERDTRIDTRRDALPMVLTNAAWMT